MGDPIVEIVKTHSTCHLVYLGNALCITQTRSETEPADLGDAKLCVICHRRLDEIHRGRSGYQLQPLRGKQAA